VNYNIETEKFATEQWHYCCQRGGDIWPFKGHMQNCSTFSKIKVLSL